MKNKKVALLILIIGLSPFLISRNIENFTLISQNQTKINEKNTFQDDFLTPKTQDDSPSSKIQFNSSEIINRSYSNFGPNSTKLSFETPDSYDIYNADIDFQVMNGTVNEDVVESTNDGGASKNQQAQSFSIDETVYLLGISISVLAKAEVSPHMEIRNNSYSGDSIYSFNPLFISGATASIWLNITFSEPIILTPSTYYLWLEEISPSASTWEKSNSTENSTDTWEFKSTWEPADFDLTLKVNTSELIDPEDVNMKIDDISVINTITGQGSAKITGNIDKGSSNTTLTISSDESIIFFYSLNSTYYRNCSIQHEFQIQQDWINWNLIIDSGYFGVPYSEYRINISGIEDNYYDIQVYNKTDVIGYSSISPGVIEFEFEATQIVFKSQNYVESVILNDNLQIGSITTINVSTKGIGDIYAFIWDDETLVHQNSSYNVSSQNFQWYLDPNLEANFLTVEIFFNGSNEIGYYSKSVNISRVSEMLSTPIHGYALENFTFSCQYWDPFTLLPISDAIVTYDFGEFSGAMKMDINGNYSNTIDLSQYSILPGEYLISINAEKENYESINSEIPITINPRIVTIELSKSRTVIAPGNTLDFEINLNDLGNQPYLLRPVDLQIRIYSSRDHANGALIHYESLEEIINKGEFSWKVPSDIEKGSYDIVVEIRSDYYIGNLNLDHAIEVKSSTFWIISLPIFIGLISSLVGGYFIKKEKVKKSILGFMILHDGGAPLAEKLSYGLQKSESGLVSGAFIGILSLIKEITGSQLRTIEIDGGFVNLINGESFWLVIFLKNNPKWIEKLIIKLKDEIQLDYGEEIINFNGRPLKFPMDEIIKKYFNTEIKTEPPVKKI